MVLTGFNVQAGDAIAFTRHALGVAKREALQSGVEPSVTVTGHSLGGSLAQITAHAFGLRGETFNAYGAAGLLHGVPRGGTQVVNHVSAVDPISAASRHFGEVRVYATAADIRHLERHGYDNDRGPDLRAPLPAALSRHSFAQHGIGNFTEGGLLDGENRTRHAAHRTMVERYREDMHLRRTLLSAPWQPLRLIAGAEDDRAAAASQPDAGHWDRRRERAPLPVHPGPPRRDPAPPAPPPWLRGLPAYVPQAGVQEPRALADRLLAALEGGDERTFRLALQAAAHSDIGRSLRAEAIALVEAHEREAREATLPTPHPPVQQPPVLRRGG
ncbi:lipase family protein, partial [Vulcaniibacterium gelatinicum]|uniref:lipase family protein n=1 Tax=Vulcaniibacterium gelatinicum TaxID=2598725 RepID=UPI001FEC7D00